jgi:drug/metabolite transporter (DMT)-like permease
MPSLFRHPVMVLFTGALIISFSSVFVKVSQVPPMVSAFYRVALGCCFLSIACWVKGEFRGQKLKSSLLAALAGLVFGIDLFCWHFSIDMIGPGLATILGNFQVFILALAGWLIYKERLGLSFALALPMAMAGLYMIIGLDNVSLSARYVAGIGLGVLTAVSYGVFILLLRHVQSGKGKRPIFYNQVLVTASCAFALGLVVAGTGNSFAIPSLSSLGALLGLGVFSQTLAWAMITYYLPRVDASRAGLILLLQPALSFVWDVLFFDRQTGPMGWIGVAVVLTAIYLGMTRQKS